MVFSVGEDLFCVLAVVGLVTLFTVALGHSLQACSDQRTVSEDFDLAVSIAERLRDLVLCKENRPGLLEPSSERLENYLRILRMRGLELRVEILALGGEIIFSEGPEPEYFRQHLPQLVRVSIPAAVFGGPGSAGMCELSIELWRG